MNVNFAWLLHHTSQRLQYDSVHPLFCWVLKHLPNFQKKVGEGELDSFPIFRWGLLVKRGMTFFRGEGCFYIKTKIWNIWWQKSLQVSYSVCVYQNYIFKNNYRYLSVTVSTVIKMLCIPFKNPSGMSFPSLGQGLSISYTAVWHTFEQMYQTMFSTCIDMEEYILFV